MYTHHKETVTAGMPLTEAAKAIVMLHGRGGSAKDIISLNKLLHLDNMAIIAPQATNNSWYPYSFMAPESQNQPSLDSALSVIGQVVSDIENAGIAPDQIFFAGFSQGACLTLEFVARHAQRYGGVIALTGGLVGEKLAEERYKGDFAGTPVFISTGDPDPHVPVDRVKDSIAVLERLGAAVTYAIYPGRPHSISAEEIRLANSHILA